MNDSRPLTFSQREGYAELPAALDLEDLPPTARTRIWNVLYAHLEAARIVGNRFHIGRPWESILKSLHQEHHVQRLDDWSSAFSHLCDNLGARVEHLPFNEVFDLIEFIMRHDECPQSLILLMSAAFKDGRLAYTIDVGPPPTIVPATTPEEGEAVKANLKELRAAGLRPATDHLHKAAKCINEGDFAGSVRESIHAVESVAKQIDPGGANTLGKALTSLQKRGVLQHEPLREAFSRLYGYTNKQGIRHALLGEGNANVTIDEAVFMLGACASFASYLWRKHQAAGRTA